MPAGAKGAAAKPGAPGAVRGMPPAPVGGTPAVPDADKITPPVTPEGTRAGHDISISGTIDAGMPLKSVQCRLHELKVDYKNGDKSRANFELAARKELPNKDFVLEFATATDEIAEGVIAHADRKGGHFMLVLQPPAKVTPAQIRPRELIFIIDISGSQQGFPLETSKAISDQVIQEVRKDDTFNVIAFENAFTTCWDKPVANTKENREKARAWIKDLKSKGGTMIDKPLTAALTGEHDPEKLRMVVLFTDGLVGHDLFVLDLVKKNAGTSRVFVYGTGNSANRFLLDNIARLGRGEVEYALSPKEAERAVKTFYNRIDAPVLTDISIDWGDLKDVVIADEVFPKALPDLFSVQPVTLKGKFKPGAKAVTAAVTVTGRTASGNYKRRVGVTLPAEAAGGNPAIPQQWARAKIEELMAEDYIGAQSGKPDPANKERIVGLGMTYRLMTQYTSFVAVEMKEITVGGEPRRVEVPVEMPEGMSYEGVFGGPQGQAMGGGGFGGGMMMRGAMAKGAAMPAPMALAALPPRPMASAAAGAAGGPMPTGRPDPAKYKAGDKVDSRDWEHASGEKAIKDDAKLTDAEKKTKVGEMKLAKVLQGLAARLDSSGNFTEGKLAVKGGKLEVAVYLNKLDAAALKELEKLGFVKLLEASSVQMVIGTIEVKKLEDLAYLDCVRRIDLPTFAK
jgi:Ca-activated chloride channel family protein